MSEEKPVRKTLCRKRISRKVQPKQFESVDISVETEDEIEWSTMEEREHKLKKHNELCIKEFQETFEAVCQELGLTDKKAFGKRYVFDDQEQPLPQPKTKPKPNLNSKTGQEVEDNLGSFADSL